MFIEERPIALGMRPERCDRPIPVIDEQFKTKSSKYITIIKTRKEIIMDHATVINNIEISDHCPEPKYVQVANAIISVIDRQLLRIGDALPTINEISITKNIARDTVEKGYKILKEKKVVSSIKGIGYFVNDHKSFDIKIAMFLNRLSPNKKEVHDALLAELGERAQIDIYVYNSDVTTLQTIIRHLHKTYDYYVLFPMFNYKREMASDVISFLPKEKTILLSVFLSEFSGNFANIYEDHERDIYGALTGLLVHLKKYRRLKLIFPDGSDYPRSIIKGFYRFCQDHEFPHELLEGIEHEASYEGDCLISLADGDLVQLFDYTEAHGYRLGRDIGVISYNETPFKQYIYNGITTISTDFALMGKYAGRCILEGLGQVLPVPFHTNVRASL